MNVKICGLRQKKDVQTAVGSGADLIGFVFAKSRRQISLAEAHILATDIPLGIKKVGVFVNPTLEEVEVAVKNVPLDMVQLHGQESLDFIRQIKLPVIKAISVTSEDDLPNFSDYPATTLFLLDAPGVQYEGGSGHVFDWQHLRPTTLPMERIIIAGGLSVTNVAAAIDYFQPYGVDVSSGVETAGQKDSTKITQFIAMAKGEQLNELSSTD